MNSVENKLTPNQIYLDRIAKRINGVESSEYFGHLTKEQSEKAVIYLNAAREDVLAKMTKEEIETYNNPPTQMTEAERRAALAETIKRMDANKDKPSH